MSALQGNGTFLPWQKFASPLIEDFGLCPWLEFLNTQEDAAYITAASSRPLCPDLAGKRHEVRIRQILS